MWEIELEDSVAAWFIQLAAADPESADLVEAAIDLLAAEGPTLGRPLVDRIQGSRRHNLKELRPGSARRSEIRILFVFDPRRHAILLVAGNKAGNWKGWYDENIPVAEARYEAYLRDLAAEEG